MNRLQSAINWISVTSEISHFFCCGLPIAFSLLSLLSSMGLVATMPTGIYELHDMMHAYEIPLIVMSGVVILLGWALLAIAKRIDCHNTGCAHGPCGTKKKRSSKILMVATALFILNLTGYIFLHG